MAESYFRPRTTKKEQPALVMEKARRRSQRFLNGKLYKIIRKNPATGIVWLWDYAEEKTVTVLMSELRKNGELAFRRWEVCDLLKINLMTLERWQRRYPQLPKSKPSSSGKRSLNTIVYYSESDIFKIRELAATFRPRGRPRKDGLFPTNSSLLTEEELAVRMERKLGLYIKASDGNFVPIWKAEI